MVLIRGGGSQLDLECFDNYNLCSHLAQFPLPIITGIGHERDETIADLVAHTKLKTPTAVAEFIIQGVSSFELLINDEAAKISKMARFILQNASISLMSMSAKIRMRAESVILNENHRMGTLKELLRNKALVQLEQQAHKMKGAATNVGAVRLQDCAGLLELMGRQQNFEGSKEIFGQLEQELQRVCDEIRKVILHENTRR